MRLRGRWVGVLLFAVLGLGAPASAQQVCGGIAGLPCPPGQFCQLAPGECCCDFFGVCADIPQACPAVCDPVCGCDGTTYQNRCEAERTGVSVDRVGPCFSPGETVTLWGFSSTQLPRLYWDWILDASGYNVYIADRNVRPPEFRCLYSAVPEPSVLLGGSPVAGDPWMFRVTALTPRGEGPLLQGGDCVTGAPLEPCVCTLPADGGPCDGAIPRWYHDYTRERCESFVWGGCGGNANNFATAAECAAACLDRCTMPAVHGDCFSVVWRWYHNVLSGRCEMFIWGGCGDEPNNFATAAECMDACVAPAD